MPEVCTNVGKSTPWVRGAGGACPRHAVSSAIARQQIPDPPRTRVFLPRPGNLHRLSWMSHGLPHSQSDACKPTRRAHSTPDPSAPGVPPFPNPHQPGLSGGIAGREKGADTTV